MTRMPIYMLAALLAAAPLSAAAQDRGDRGRDRDRDRERERPSAERQDERPRVSVGAPPPGGPAVSSAPAIAAT